jgi:hypothetical protein
MVLDLIDSGAERQELIESYPFLTDAHITAARDYLAEHPAHQAQGPVPDNWKLKSKTSVKQPTKA